MRTRSNSWLLSGCFLLLLILTAAFLHARNKPEVLPPYQQLQSFPIIIGDSFGQDLPLSQEELDVLGDGEFMHRQYRSQAAPVIDLFIAFFPTQRTGSTIHSPQNCLPGAGWTPVEAGRILMPGLNGTKIPVNRYLIAKGLDRQFVLYWYQSHGRVVASEYWSKFYLVTDSIRMHRSDGALVRVITPLMRGESEESAQSRTEAFAQQVLPYLNSYIPR
jgi:EpsI family protein